MIEPRTALPPSTSSRIGFAIFLVAAVALVFYVKWDPYVAKAFKAAATGSVGSSIVSGTATAPPGVSFGSALDYGISYGLSIWQALVAGLVIGAGVQVLLPRDWLRRILGRRGVKSSVVAAAAAVPSMMCTCCSAPIAVGMRKSDADPGAVLAFWLGNPVLNPAVVIFLGFVLGWGWALLRIVVGLGLVAVAAWLGSRVSADKVPEAADKAWSAPNPEAISGNLFVRWFKTAFRLALLLVPEYLVIVLALGATRAWLFPAMSPAIGHSVLLFIGLAIAGTLFVIPTAGEVPIVQSLTAFGLGPLGAGALMITLPAVSLPSLAMLGRALPVKLLVQVAAVVAVFGLVTGGLAALFGL